MSEMSQKKQIFKLSILRKFLNDANSCVSLVPTTRLLALPPFFLNDMKSGIFYLLNSILKKYDRSLDGIVMGYQNVKILMDENTGIIPIGSAETEVNVSVEFYIFQPKIGNTLEDAFIMSQYFFQKWFVFSGVVNKKSNNHIGCLVHRYFNATILKPEDVDYEDWNCKGFDVNDKILFKVKDLDFTGLLPYIEGIVQNEDLSDCAKSKKMDGYDSDVHNDSQSKVVKERKSLKENSLKSKKGLPQHNELFYSTQLEPNSESKMDTSCSPIPKRLSSMKNDELKMSPVSNKVKKKDRKRKAEECNEATAAKKFKKEQNQINEDVDFMDEFIQQELSRVEEELDMSEKEITEKETKENDSVSKTLMKEVKNDTTPEKNKAVDSGATSKKKKKKKHKENEKFRNGSMYDVEITPEKANLDKRQKRVSDSEKSNETSVKEKNVNGVTSTKKYSVQTLLDQFFLEEGKKLKSRTANESVKEPTKEKKERKSKSLPKETEESLYEKLLREARSQIEMREDSHPKKKQKTKSKPEVP